MIVYDGANAHLAGDKQADVCLFSVKVNPLLLVLFFVFFCYVWNGAPHDYPARGEGVRYLESRQGAALYKEKPTSLLAFFKPLASLSIPGEFHFPTIKIYII